MATSMAAALAASIPAPQPAAAPAPPPLEIPASMSKVIDVEGEIPVKVVQLDGLVVTKIIKHGRDIGSAGATGLLLGLDLDGTLEVSNCFPLPSTFHTDDEDKALARSTAAARYQATMLRSLKEVQGDDSVVGFYQTTSMGALFHQSLVDTQALHQSKLRHGGIVIVHDVTQAASNATFRAFRLTPKYLEAFRKGKFSTQSLIDHELTFSRILEELPVIVKNSSLLNAFLGTLTAAKPQPSLQTPVSILPPAFATLDLDSPQLLTRNLESMIDSMEAYKNEESNVAYALRQIAREKAKAEVYVTKRKEESAARVAQGLAPLPEEDVSRLFRIPPEPSRLEGMLMLGQIDGRARTLDVAANAGLVKMYAARSSSIASP